MLRIVITPLAWPDLDEAFDYYLEKASLATALRMNSGFRDAIVRVATNPGIGRSRGRLMTGLRQWRGKRPAHNYRVFYRVMPDAIEIVRILHGAQNEREVFDEDVNDQ